MNDPITHPHFARVYEAVGGIGEWLFLDELREEICRDLSGTVLDIGAGTGTMLEPISRLSAPESIHYVALEPDGTMRQFARPRLVDSRVETTLVAGAAETLPFAENSFDSVLCSLVLCSVQDLRHSLDEIARVLQPGGELRILEHVASEGIEGSFQHTIRPLWSRVAGGCDPHRHTGQIISESGHFSPIDIQLRAIGVPPIRPFLVGRYRAQVR